MTRAKTQAATIIRHSEPSVAFEFEFTRHPDGKLATFRIRIARLLAVAMLLTLAGSHSGEVTNAFKVLANWVAK